MEIFTIDPTNSNRREAIIEKFDSFIWTDRYAAYGDFEIVAEPSADMVSRLVPGVHVGFDESDRVMVIESALRATSSDGKKVLTIKGKSLEAILEDRIAKIAWISETWDLYGTPGTVVAEMVSIICLQEAGISTYDGIPHITSANLVNGGEVKTISIKIGTLYERIKEICDTFDIGFRITVTPGLAPLDFRVYSGTDRTGENGVAFSEDLENLSETSYLVSKEGYKNVAYVICGDWNRIVTATGAEDVSGLNRKVILVVADDIDAGAGTELDEAMDQRGLDALSKCQAVMLFDGVADPGTMYRYNTHYFLGDRVVLRGDGERKEMRVTEHIWSYGSDGLKSYPTFSAIGGVGVANGIEIT